MHSDVASARAQLDAWRALPAETEWLEFKAARQQFDPEDLGRYVSALANEANLAGRDAGWLVFGVADKREPATGLRPVCGSRFAMEAAHRNDIKRRVAVGTSPAMSLAEPIEVHYPECAEGSRVQLWRVPAAPAGMPVAWHGHFYGRDGESLGPLALHELETIRMQSALRDWSAQPVEGGWDQLDSAALARARELYGRRHRAHGQVLAELIAGMTPNCSSTCA